MQKKIIALAVAGLMSGAAFAQSNVTIYGVVDAYAVTGSAKGATKDSFDGINAGGLSGSRIGFKGMEDIGGGLKAVYVAELGTLDTTANANTLTASDTADATKTVTTTTNGIDTWRQAYVGLTGGFGTAVAGRLQTLGYDWGVKYDAHGASIFSPVGQLTDNLATSISGRDASARADNAFAYISPNFAGFTAKFNYAFGEQVEGQASTGNAALVDKRQSIWGVGADYDNGPLSAGFAYHNIGDVGGTRVGTNEASQKEWGLGAKYNFGMITPVISYQQMKTESATGVEVKTKVWNIGARANVSANGSVGLAYAKSSQSDAGDDKGTAWGLDYQHNLSKRTTAYVGYASMKSKNGAAYEFQNLKGSSLGQTVSADADQKSSQLAIGVRHTF